MVKETGPLGPVFFLLLFGLAGCAPKAVQSPTIDLNEVHGNGAHRIAFDRDSHRLASGGLHGGVRVWSVTDGTALQSFKDHGSGITGLAWIGPDTLVSAEKSGRLLVRDISSGNILYHRELGNIDGFAISPDAGWLAAIGDKGLLKLSLPGLQQLDAYRPTSAAVAIAIDGWSGRLALSTRDGRVQLLNADLEPLHELPRASRDAQSLVFSPDGHTLLGGGWFRLLVWDLRTGKLEERRTEHLGKITSVDISPDGRYWISLGRETDSNFQMVDALSGEVLRRFKAHELCGQEARFSPDGRYVASSADDGSIHIYDLTRPYTPRMPYLESD